MRMPLEQIVVLTVAGILSLIGYDILETRLKKDVMLYSPRSGWDEDERWL